MSIASSGDWKSTTDNEALSPVTRRENALQEIYARDHQDWLVTHAAWAAERATGIEGDRQARV